MRGFFITLEGPEGSGKTTQVERLVARLKAAGYEVVKTREPGGTPAGEAIRRILKHEAIGEQLCPEAEALLFAASRAQLVRTVILPALERGACVVCDRFADSTLAYQGYGRGLGCAPLEPLNSFVIDGAVPDLTVLLDIDVRAGLVRLAARNQASNGVKDRLEREDLNFHERTRQGYLELAARWPERIQVVDAAQAMEEVERQIWQLVETRLRVCGRRLARHDRRET
ncbi:MAG: dTMP kinase [Kiritimatiellae bacterium]|nr:dTMP kinase [Kiritimatiellia bacterium]